MKRKMAPRQKSSDAAVEANGPSVDEAISSLPSLSGCTLDKQQESLGVY
jgi:hypothetical protein